MKTSWITRILAAVSPLLFFANASDPCEQIYPSLRTRGIPAALALDCLKSVPLDVGQAKETIHQLRLYMQFYSAQAYFGKPPEPKLELVPVELNKTLDEIEKKLGSNGYSGFYSFSKAIFDMFGLYRDGHVSFMPSCLTPFYFRHDYPLISLGSSPSEIPKIYLAHVARDGQLTVGDQVVKINDGDPVEFLTKLTRTSPSLDWVDPDARFNNLMASMYGGAWSLGAFAGRSTLEDELIGLKLLTANGTNINVEWRAILHSETLGPDDFKSSAALGSRCFRADNEMEGAYSGPPPPGGAENRTGYDQNVKRDMPQPPLESKLRARSSAPPFPEAWRALPEGEFAVYHLDDQTAVLVIRAFSGGENWEPREFLMAAHTLVQDALTYLTANHYKRLVIDVTGNGGGYVALGVDTVRQLFPDKDHFFAINMRWSPALATMLTEGQDPRDTYWDYRRFNNEKGQDLKSVQEFLGPVHRDGDYFSPIMRTDVVEITKSAGLSGSSTGHQPFATKNILILSSGTCGSTCAIFAEALMEVGVHSVVFGGRPKKAEMQLVGGIKGSQVLLFDDISWWVHYFLGDKIKNYDYIPTPFRIRLDYGSLNFRNSFRKDEELPIEFLYDPAQYRLAYTEAMTQNMTVMWEAARDVVWGSNHDSLGGPGDDGSEGHGSSHWSSWGQVIWEKIRPAYTFQRDL